MKQERQDSAPDMQDEEPETSAQDEHTETAVEKEEEEELPAGTDENYHGPVVNIRGLYKSFKDHHVLNGVTLQVNKGENLVVLGKSGSGKSVLIKCLVGLIHPDA